MKIAVSAEGKTIEAAVEPRFGRCPFLLFFDSDSGEIVDAFHNPFTTVPSGAGTKTAQHVVNQGAGVVLTGMIGHKAMSILEAAGVRCLTGAVGSVVSTTLK